MEKVLILVLVVAVVGVGAFLVVSLLDDSDGGSGDGVVVEDIAVETVDAPVEDTKPVFTAESTPTPEAANAAPLAERGPDEMVQGHVRDESGSPIAGARIELFRYTQHPMPQEGKLKIRFDEAEKTTTESDEDGAYTFEGVRATGPFLTLRAVKAGFVTVIKDKVGPGMTVDFGLRKGALVKGVVTDIDTQKPIEGVVVEANYRREASTLHDYFRWRDVTHTDAAGRYRFDGVPEGDITILLEHDLYEQTFVGTQQKLTVSSMVDNEFDFELRRGIILDGVVVAADTGRPIKGATIQLR